ncbi:hypothetical protein DRQ32_04140, partial [bacterium]
IAALLALGTGFFEVDRANTLLDFNNSTRTFTFEIKADIDYYIKGDRFSLTSGVNPTIVVPAVEAEYHIYLDENGDLSATTSWSIDTILEGNCFVASVYWDATNSECVFLLDERHAMMDPAVHFYLHRRFSAYLESGCALGGIDAAGNGNDDSHAQFSIDSGELIDEDISHTIDAYLTSDTKRLLYLDGATPNLRRAPSSSVPLYKATNRLYFNEFSGGSWGLTEVGSNGDYTWLWIAITPDHLPDQQAVGIMGQAEYGNANQAKDGGPTELASLVNLLPQDEVQIVAGILYQTASTYSNTWAARIRPEADGNDYWDLRNAAIGSGSPPSDHNALAGRSDAACHPDTAIAISGTHAGLLSAATDVDEAMTVLDDLAGSDIDIEDVDVDTTSTFTDWLSGVSGTVKSALDHIDKLASLLMMRNDASIAWRQVTGGGPYGWLSGIKVNASDEVEIGSADITGIVMKNDVDLEANNLETTGEVIAAQGDIPHLRSTNVKTLADGVATEFCRVFFDAAPDGGGCLFHYTIEVVAGTAVQSQTGIVALAQTRTSLARAGTMTDLGTPAQSLSSGTLAVNWNYGTSGTDHGRIKCNANTSLIGATITMTVTAIGNADKLITWS